jgi:hypothetical protein
MRENNSQKTDIIKNKRTKVLGPMMQNIMRYVKKNNSLNNHKYSSEQKTRAHKIIVGGKTE